MPAKKGAAYVEVGKEGTIEAMMAGKKGKREAADKPAAKESAKKARKEKAPKKEVTAAAAEAVQLGQAPAADVEMKEEQGIVGSGRVAAQNLSLKEKVKVKLSDKQDRIAVKEEQKCESEKDALEATAAGSPDETQRRLGEFSVVNEAGQPEPVDAMDFSDKELYISGVVYPKDGPTSKETGRRVQRFGPLKGFSLDLSTKAARVVLETDSASYTCIRPAASYKKLHTHLSDQADICCEVFHALNTASGGSPQATLEEVVARLARSQLARGYPSAREALMVNGRFLLAQLAKQRGHKGFCYSDTDFCRALQREVKDFKYVGSQKQNTGIIIRDGKAQQEQAAAADGADAQLAADEEFARQMQAKEDAKARNRGPKGGAPKGGKGAAYIKVSEAEIADDYPAPTPYNKEEEETDELLLFDEELMDVDPEFLPRRLLTDFTIYNAEGLNASLELLPMWSGVDSDVELYASGVVVEDDGEWAGGQSLEAPPVAAEEAAAGSSAEAAGAGGSSSAAGGSSSAAAPAAAQEPAGMRMYLSQIREWIVECSCDQLFISIRTDVAWYRLSQPAAKYAPWFAVVLKVARLAVKVLGMLSAEARASRLSFNDIVKHLAQQDEAQSTFVSKKLPVVERFVVVHGQIILNQFQNYPKEAVRRSAFATGLKEHMQMVRHSKLYKEVAKPVHMRKAVNRNPMKDRAAGKKSKPMTATATTMVKAIWQSYFNVPGQKKDGEGDGQTADLAVEAPAAKEVEEDENEEEPEDDNQEDALAHPTSPTAGRQQQKKTVAKKKKKPALPKGAWVGGVDKTVDGDKFYKKAKVGEVELSLGAVVLLQQEDDSSSDSEDPAEGEEPAEAPLGLVQAMWQTPDGEKQVQVRLMARGGETVLGDAASVDELFLTTKLETRVLSGVTGTVVAKQLCRDVDPAKRLQYAKEDAELRERNEAAAKEGGPLEYFWRRQYVPEKGMYCDLPRDLQLGTRLPEGDGKPKKGVRALEGGKGFVKDGVEYREGDCLYVGPAVFDQLEDAQQERELPEYLANSRFHKGSYEGLRAWGIGQLVRLGATSSKKDKEAGKAGAGKDSGKVTSLTLKRFYRPEDVSKELAYKSSSYHEVYASEELVTVSVEDVVGKCRIVPEGYPTAGNTFVCTKTFTRKGKKFSAAPKLEAPEDLEPVPAADAKAASKDKGKGKAAAMEVDGGESQDPLLNDGIALATMDIFAGCGGLSEGMHQAGAAYTKWAVEYEHPAAEAFKLNNPDAAVFCNNCNVLLHAAMAKAGLGDDCMASQEAEEESAALPVDQLAALPLPGEVDFICGGPPCQGYSGMNRFNKGNWSMVQNSMVMAFLSYCDFYRPRYFLLENVRNFVSHNKSFTFRLTVRSLLDMGYQVRFGVLNAGNFGVAQSRKRTFIWAAAPGELLPDWPQLMHCFRTPQLTINLPGGVQYTAVPQTVGAPLRPVTVRDTIGDLPAIENGHNLDEMDYPGAPVSAFQRTIRGSCQKLTEHICKTMNELNLERCRCIPKNAPGADWRVLEEIVKADPSREKYNGQPLVPWCLPNTADRHNGWRGLFGRLDFEGHFPTSTTDPQPMGKVGQVFHPEQDRIVSVRECARAQGFPDKHRFYGNVHNKHRQVGNAVPPPLAAALGRQLRKALEEQAERDAQERLAAQL